MLILVLGAGGSSYWLFEVKQASDRRGQNLLLRSFWKLFQFTRQGTSYPLRYMTGKGRECLVLVFRERAEFFAQDFQFLPA